MRAVPMSVLVRALAALNEVHERELNRQAKDPFMAVLRARSELGYYVDKMLEETKVEVEA